MTEKPEGFVGNEVDYIMNLDPLELTQQPEAVDKAILYLRRMRAQFELGVKPKKEQGPAPDLSNVLSALVPAAPEKPAVKRRF